MEEGTSSIVISATDERGIEYPPFVSIDISSIFTRFETLSSGKTMFISISVPSLLSVVAV